MLNLGKRTIQVATLYLDDMNEDVRHRQLQAALNNLEDEPTLLAGDFNTLRPRLKGAALAARLHNFGIQAAASAFGLLPEGQKGTKLHYYQQAIRQVNRRSIVPALEQAGFTDADPSGQPTMRHMLGQLGVDYAFYNAGVQVENFAVVPAGEASNHHALRVSARPVQAA